MRIVLIGYRGTGKTTVGQVLADLLGWPLIDTDVLVEQRAGGSIREIFARVGEDGFRDLEAAVIADLRPRDAVVISAGGGAILREANRLALRHNSLVAWLTAPAETLHQRIAADATTAARRPDLTTLTGLSEIRHLLEVREPLYRATADMTVDTGTASPDETAQLILAHYRRV